MESNIIFVNLLETISWFHTEYFFLIFKPQFKHHQLSVNSGDVLGHDPEVNHHGDGDLLTPAEPEEVIWCCISIVLQCCIPIVYNVARLFIFQPARICFTPYFIRLERSHNFLTFWHFFLTKPAFIYFAYS